MNAINGQSSVSLLVNNNTIASGIGYGAASGYAGVSSGSQPVQINSGSATLLNLSLSINGGENNTILATLSGATVFTDNKSTPPSNDVQIRAINASNTLGTADVYVVPSNTDISTMNPTATLAFQAASGYQTLAAGTYEVLFTQAGSKIPIINSGAISFTAGQIRTVVSLDGNGFSASVLSDLN
ncbi:MAG TPA: DUF4397 domain-containing protein [Terriglobales bacterium]|nr:DUF4397 domain-containing protein [Terriglobales bacterium]